MSNVDLSEASTEIMHIGAMTKKCPYCGSVYTNKRNILLFALIGRTVNIGGLKKKNIGNLKSEKSF